MSFPEELWMEQTKQNIPVYKGKQINIQTQKSKQIFKQISFYFKLL